MTYRKLDNVRVVTVTRTSASASSDEEPKITSRRNEMDKLIDGVLTPHARHVNEVTIGTSAKISDHVYWGVGTWDRVSYSVECFCSVKICTDTDKEKIDMAKEIAYDISFGEVQKNLQRTAAGIITAIKKDLFVGYFKEDNK